jgi:hypothetical protein
MVSHAPRGDRNALEAHLKPFVDYALGRRRASGSAFVSHSSTTRQTLRRPPSARIA